MITVSCYRFNIALTFNINMKNHNLNINLRLNLFTLATSTPERATITSKRSKEWSDAIESGERENLISPVKKRKLTLNKIDVGLEISLGNQEESLITVRTILCLNTTFLNIDSSCKIKQYFLQKMYLL